MCMFAILVIMITDVIITIVALDERNVNNKLICPPNALPLYIVQTDYSSGDKPLVYSCEYHLPDAFAFVVWRRDRSRLRGPSNDGAR